MSQTWPTEIWETQRIHAACFQVGCRFIQGGVIYGHAFQSETTRARQLTDDLCQHMTDRLIAQSQGMRFFGGDFNQRDGAIDSMAQWTDKGWVMRSSGP